MSRDPLSPFLDRLATKDRDAAHAAGDAAAEAFLARPDLGAALVDRFCATDTDAAKADRLGDLLDAALRVTRLAEESGNASGAALRRAIEGALATAAAEGRLDDDHRLRLAPLWPRNGLTAPAALELDTSDIDSALPDDAAGEGEAMLARLLHETSVAVGGDALAFHTALVEMFPAMPAPVRGVAIAICARQATPFFDEVTAFWLLDRDPAFRRAAAEAVADRARTSPLPADFAARLVRLRGWLPEDPARTALDAALRNALRHGTETAPKSAPWVVHDCLASLVDGAGAQSLAVALRRGGQRRVAMILLKEGLGVKDAFLVPFTSATQQKTTMQRMVESAGAMPVSRDCIERVLGLAIADGLEAGLPPAPALAEIATLCGFDALHPLPESTEALVANLPDAARIAALDPAARRALVAQSEDWWGVHGILDSWFEASDDVLALLDAADSSLGGEAAFWTWLETRRDAWARILARCAIVLAANRHPHAESFTAGALALTAGEELKSLRFLQVVFDITVESWLAKRNGQDGQDPQDLQDLAPEAEGELAGLIAGSGATTDWIDGFVLAAGLAPEPIEIEDAIDAVLDRVAGGVRAQDVTRLADLVYLRCERALTDAADPLAYQAAMALRGAAGQQDWARGFDAAVKTFKRHWPRRLTRKDDVAMLARIAAAATNGFDRHGTGTLATWIAQCHDRAYAE